VLKACAASLAGAARATDLVARIGGDEFAVLLRYTDEEGAAVWCEQVTSLLGSQPGWAPGASMAAGCAAAPPAGTLAEALVQADRRMYGAKTAR
jgi:diguanylate cyclase (GGDEF)-like protein